MRVLRGIIRWSVLRRPTGSPSQVLVAGTSPGVAGVSTELGPEPAEKGGGGSERVPSAWLQRAARGRCCHTQPLGRAQGPPDQGPCHQSCLMCTQKRGLNTLPKSGLSIRLVFSVDGALSIGKQSTAGQS